MATQLSIYKDAFVALGQTPLGSLADNLALRIGMDAVYPQVLQECFLEGQWNFAKTTVKIAKDSGYTPTFGWQFRHPKPADFGRLLGISLFEYVEDDPLERYEDTPGYWMCDSTPIYVRYTQTSLYAVGTSEASYPSHYAAWVAIALALRVAPTISFSEGDTKLLIEKLKKFGARAKNLDAMLEPNKLWPPGSFVRARLGRAIGRRYDRAGGWS